MLRSLNAVTKETTIAARILGWPSPDPGLGSPVELSGGNTGGLLDFLRIGETLTSKGITAEEAPPAFLEVEPTGSSRNEDVMDARMPFQPGARLQAEMTREIIRDDENVAAGVVGFDVGQKRDVAFGIA